MFDCMAPPAPHSPHPPRRILHVDVDAMFVQCARLADPERLGAEDLLIVGGRPEGRGVVASASYGCRAYGVRSAMSTAHALRLCPRAVVVGVPGATVREKSRALRSVLARWAPVVQMASVDEAYLDLTGCELLYGGESPADAARRIQAALRDETELDVSLGGGSNKLVAKLATGLAKPAGVRVVEPGGELDFVAGFRPGDLPGVGPTFAAELERRGVGTIRALRALERSTLAGWWGEERALWLWERVRGISHVAVEAGRVTKSVSAERTYPRDLHTAVEQERALLALVAEAAQALRAKGLAARTVTVKLRDPEFRDRQRSRTLPEAVRTERAILPVAKALLAGRGAGRAGAARLLGVGLSGLAQPGGAEQGSLAELAPPLESDRDRRIAAATDVLRARFGSTAVVAGGVLGGTARSGR